MNFPNLLVGRNDGLRVANDTIGLFNLYPA